MKKKDRYEAVISWFKENMPVAETELDYKSPYQLMVAVILSAQCTDKRVNLITPELFLQIPDLETMASCSQDFVFSLIRSCSYPNNKAKHLIAAAQTIMKNYNGKVPDSIEELQEIPGIGRKTANVIASVAFSKPAFAVDTHVHRVAARIGLTLNAKTPLDTENQVTAQLPVELWAIAHHWLILHGRYVCQARKPKCAECGIASWCLYYSELKSSDATI